jgi:hypothetical protein
LRALARISQQFAVLEFTRPARPLTPSGRIFLLALACLPSVNSAEMMLVYITVVQALFLAAYLRGVAGLNFSEKPRKAYFNSDFSASIDNFITTLLARTLNISNQPTYIELLYSRKNKIFVMFWRCRILNRRLSKSKKFQLRQIGRKFVPEDHFGFYCSDCSQILGVYSIPPNWSSHACSSTAF